MAINASDYGIETELNIESCPKFMKDKANNEYWEVADADWNTIQVCKDEEYYASQIEFKKYPSAYSKFTTSMQIWKDFITTKLRNGLRINGREWVGTHIHLFLKKDDGSPLQQQYDVKVPIVRYLLGEVLKHFAKYENKEFSTNRELIFELERMCRSHSIWRYFDMERLNNRLRNNMKLFGFDYVNFKDGTDKKKYAPVIWSLANAETGKPLSLEVRLMPNSYLIGTSSEKLKADFDEVVRLVNNRTPQESDEYTECIKDITEFHMVLCSALVSLDTRRIKKYCEIKFNK